MWKIRVIGNMNNEKDRTFESANRIYDKKYCCPTIPTCGGGGLQPKTLKRYSVKACAMRGRNPDNPSDRTPGIHLEQRIETKDNGVSNCISTISKDAMYVARIEMEKSKVEDYLYNGYGVFKLTSRECLRLMNVDDEDIDKMQAINSNTQCYKQAGNSIVVSVLCAIFSQLNIKDVKPWNERTEEERRELYDRRKFFTQGVRYDERK